MACWRIRKIKQTKLHQAGAELGKLHHIGGEFDNR